MNTEAQILEMFVEDFSQETLLKAIEVAKTYHVITQPAPGGGWLGMCAEVYVSVHRPQQEECYVATFNTVVCHVASLITEGADIPLPQAIYRRTEQVNVRLTPKEKHDLQTLAKRRGVSISDYLRSAGLAAMEVEHRSDGER